MSKLLKKDLLREDSSYHISQIAKDSLLIKPRRLSQSAQPTPAVGELILWHDTDDSKTYLVYNDTDEGVRKVELI